MSAAHRLLASAALFFFQVTEVQHTGIGVNINQLVSILIDAHRAGAVSRGR